MASSNAYAIEYVYKLIDQYTDVIKKMGEKSQEFAKKSHEASEHASKGFKLFGINVASILSAETLEKLGEKAFEFGKESMEAAEKAQVGMTLLKNTIENLREKGGPSFDELNKKATELSKNSIFSAPQIMQGTTQSLLMFKSVQGKTFDSAQKAAIDVTAAFNGINASTEDLAHNGALIGRSLENPIQGMLRLRSIGVIFSQQQKAVIKTLTEQGRLEEARQVVLHQIYANPKIKNAAEALAETGEGLRRRVKNQVDAMKIQVGNALLPISDMFLNLSLKVMPKVQKAIDGIMPIFKAVFSLIESLMPVVDSITDDFGDFGDVVNIIIGVLQSFIAGVSVVVNFLKPFIPLLARIVLGIVAFNVVMEILNILMAANPIGLIIIGIAALILIIGLLAQNWTKITKAVGNFFTGLWNGVVNFSKSIIKTISGMLDNPIIRTLALIFLPFITVPALIIKNWSNIGRFFSDLFRSVADNPLVKSVIGFFAGKNVTVNTPRNPSVPVASTQSVNVNSKSSVSVYTEKNMKVVPYQKSHKLGYQGAQ